MGLLFFGMFFEFVNTSLISKFTIICFFLRLLKVQKAENKAQRNVCVHLCSFHLSLQFNEMAHRC